jgi:hypothetical protein
VVLAMVCYRLSATRVRVWRGWRIVEGGGDVRSVANSDGRLRVSGRSEGVRRKVQTL